MITKCAEEMKKVMKESNKTMMKIIKKEFIKEMQGVKGKMKENDERMKRQIEEFQAERQEQKVAQKNLESRLTEAD